jgi:hypothetical protein
MYSLEATDSWVNAINNQLKAKVENRVEKLEDRSKKLEEKLVEKEKQADQKQKRRFFLGIFLKKKKLI